MTERGLRHGPRVVSLVPSATETLLAWGVAPVAVTRFCEQGDRFPTVGGTKNPDIEAIVALRPDVVVMCDQENRLDDANALTAAGVRVHAITITALSQVLPEMTRLAEAVGLPPRIGASCDPALSGVDAASARAVTAFVPIWRRPWMTLNDDTYGISLLHHLGVRGVADGHADRYPELDLDAARSAGATLVLAPSEPYEFTERHREELSSVAPVAFVDGRDLFWWGSRTPAALARLAAVVHDALPSASSSDS